MVKAKKSCGTSLKSNQRDNGRSEIMTRIARRDTHSQRRCDSWTSRKGSSPDSVDSSSCCSSSFLSLSGRRGTRSKIRQKDSSTAVCGRELHCYNLRAIEINKGLEIEEEIMTSDMNEVILTTNHDVNVTSSNLTELKYFDGNLGKFAAISGRKLQQIPSVHIERFNKSNVSSLPTSDAVSSIEARIKVEPLETTTIYEASCETQLHVVSVQDKNSTIKTEKNPKPTAKQCSNANQGVKSPDVLKKINGDEVSTNGESYQFNDVPVTYVEPRGAGDKLLNAKKHESHADDSTSLSTQNVKTTNSAASSPQAHATRSTLPIVQTPPAEVTMLKPADAGKTHDHRKKPARVHRHHGKRLRPTAIDSSVISDEFIAQQHSSTVLVKDACATETRQSLGAEVACDAVSNCNSANVMKSIPSKPESKPPKHRTKTKASLLASFSDFSSTFVKPYSIRVPGLNSCSSVDEGIKRRRVVEEETFSNRRLEQQACILWSSEQKRRFQQQNPDACSEMLDNIMRSHWESLSDRDRHRYMQRARCAMTVERSRQLSRRGLTQQLSWKDEALLKEAALVRRLQHCTALQLRNLFNSCTAEYQAEIIRHKLWSLQRRLTDIDYQRLARQFSSNLLSTNDPEVLEARQQLLSADRSATEEAHRKLEDHARHVMFQTVEAMETKVDELMQCRVASLQWQTKLQFEEVVMGLITNPSMTVFPTDCFSQRLEQLLKDLNDIEDDLGMRCDEGQEAEAIHSLEAELSQGWFAGSTSISIDGQNIVIPNVINQSFLKSLLVNSSFSSIKPLSPDDVDTLLLHPGGCEAADGATVVHPSEVMLVEAASHVYRLLHGLEMCCGLDSPSCVLSTLLVHDRLRRLEETDSTTTTSTPEPANSRPSSRRSGARKEVRRRKPAAEGLGLCGSEDGIPGADSLFMSPLEMAAGENMASSSHATSREVDKQLMTSNSWQLLGDNVDLGLLHLLQENNLHEVSPA